MTTVAVLAAARSLIADSRNWTQEALARDGFDNEVKVGSATAQCFCMVGAVMKVSPNTDDYGRTIRALRNACGDGSIYTFNDSHGHRAVIKAFNRAMELAVAA